MWLAVVSQPHRRDADVPAPGTPDASLGEFWVGNPFDFAKHTYNLSSYERNRIFLNVRRDGPRRNFLEFSYLSGADSDGDGRCVVGGDFRNTGQIDLLVRQVGGGPLLLYENNFPRQHYLKVSLRGRPGPDSPGSNRQGIGARLTAYVKGQPVVRELYPLNSYRSQMPNQVHFGLGKATEVDRLVVRWPSGLEQEFANLAADRHIVLDEAKSGPEAIETVIPGQTIVP